MLSMLSRRVCPAVASTAKTLFFRQSPIKISKSITTLTHLNCISNQSRIGFTCLRNTTASCFNSTKRGMANQRHKKMIKLAKGFSGRAKNCFKIAKLKVQKGMQYSYKARRVS